MDIAYTLEISRTQTEKYTIRIPEIPTWINIPVELGGDRMLPAFDTGR
jgi:hypothetical protein